MQLSWQEKQMEDDADRHYTISLIRNLVYMLVLIAMCVCARVGIVVSTLLFHPGE